MGKFILIGAVIGSLLSLVIDFSVLAGLVLGAIAGGIIKAIYARRTIKDIKRTNEPADQTMRLREEQLDIKKERVQAGEVKIHKEVVEEQKTFTVPIRREEMVIEAGGEEDFRIPLKEEEVEIIKHPVQVAEVSVFKRQIEEVQQIKEKLKKETASSEIKGVADVKEKRTL